MANFKSEIISLNSKADSVYDKLSNPENLRELMDKAPADQLPEDKRKIFEQMTLTPDSITIPGGPTGPITLRMARKEPPTLISMTGEGVPVPMKIELHIIPEGENCKAYVEIDIEIPKMLAPMVSGPMQKMTEQFATLLKSVAAN